MLLGGSALLVECYLHIHPEVWAQLYLSLGVGYSSRSGNHQRQPHMATQTSARIYNMLRPDTVLLLDDDDGLLPLAGQEDIQCLISSYS